MSIGPRILSWRTFLPLLAACLIAGGPSLAYPLLIDYTGFTWTESDGQQTSMFAVGVIDDFTPDIPDPTATFTYFLSDLELSQVQDLGGGFFFYDYSGGRFDMYQSTDASNAGYEYGSDPPNGTAPSSFTDGLYWLGGGLSSFSVLIDTIAEIGTVSGVGAYDGGAFYGQLGEDALFTFGGLTQAPGSGVPPGYEYRIDGQLNANVQPIPEPASLLLLGGGLLGALVRRRKRD